MNNGNKNNPLNASGEYHNNTRYASSSEQARRPNNTPPSQQQKNPNRQGNPTPRQPLRPQQTHYQSPRPNVNGLSDNLRSQTPLNRTLRKQNAPAEPGTVRRDNAPQHFKVKSDLKTKQKPKTKPKHKKTSNRSLFSFIAITGLIIYAVLVPIIILCVNTALPRHTSKHTGDYVYQLGPDKNVYSSKIYDYSKVRVGNEYYINMDSLAEYCSLTTTGNGERLRYVVRSSGDYVEFVVGQSIAYINGVQERTGGIVLLKNNVLYVPMSFAKRCFFGVEINLDEENNKITIIRDQNSDNEYIDLSFPYKLPNLSSCINFAALDTDIQEQIILQNQSPQEPEVIE